MRGQVSLLPARRGVRVTLRWRGAGPRGSTPYPHAAPSCMARTLISENERFGRFFINNERSVKPVGSAYVGSNPTPAATCRNGQLAANSRAGGPFLLGPGVCHLVALQIVMLRCPRTHSGRASVPHGRSVCTVAAVGAHRRLFHGRPRTGCADHAFRAYGERRSRACIPCGHRRSARLPWASRPYETGDRRQCSPRGPTPGRPPALRITKISGLVGINDAVTETTPLPSGRRRSDPFRGGYHGTWLTPSARRYRIHPERRIGTADRSVDYLGNCVQIIQYGACWLHLVVVQTFLDYGSSDVPTIAVASAILLAEARP